ncbi:NEL-type E3 ubiquitin ligase domain-containing protein [Escherichia coli]|uniref:NEL-type E3 ubiquitin ligase domain-containing protein n=1 Tax=Escherichia coli TaxID=562 RepID=UPI0038B394E6
MLPATASLPRHVAGDINRPVFPVFFATFPTDFRIARRCLLGGEPFTDGRDTLTKILLSLRSTDSPNIYSTPDSVNEGKITLNLSVFGEATVTLSIPGEALESVTLTPVSQLWENISNAPALAEQIKPWRDWASEYAPRESRVEALRRVTKCVLNGGTKLKLDHLRLTSLPENLPAGLTHLDVNYNPLTSLPEDLPAGLTYLNVRDNPLTSLPENLPAGLTYLDVRDNQLTSLPENLPAGLTYLDVSCNPLTSLPENLPAGLKKLYVSNNQLASLPEDLPAGLTHLDVINNQLTSLPEVLPAGLNTLNVSCNPLTSLPENLPAGLKKLYVSDNQLTSLPEVLPAGLTYLNVSHTLLTRLPAVLSASLEDLYATNNNLTRLPDVLPAGLTHLDVSHNQLTSLPEVLPAGLMYLYVNYNQLTSLPEVLPVSLRYLEVKMNSLTRLPDVLPDGLEILNVSDNPLSEPELEDEPLTHPDVFYNQLTSLPDVLHVTLWFPFHQREAQQARWEPLLKEENAAEFTRFLNALSNSVSAEDETFRGQVQLWLEELSVTPQLRQLTFGLAQEASESCADRAALGWNTMQTTRLLYHAEQSPGGYPPQDFLRLSEQIFCIQKINDIATEKAKRLQSDGKEIDTIEVWLGYFSQLTEILRLPDLFVNKMNFRNLSGLTDDDINAAVNSVLADKARDFLTWLEGWEPCQKYLQRNMTEDERNALAERRLNEYDAELKKLSSEADLSSPEVVILTGQQATERVNKTIFGPLIASCFKLAES